MNQEPINILMSPGYEVTVHSIDWLPELDGEIIGHMMIAEGENKEAEQFDMWFEDDGYHYICMAGEKNGEVEVWLVMDLLKEEHLNNKYFS